jgi:hypothetical protein
VKGDRIRLEQVVRNLVDNAIKFTPGGGRVTVHTELRAPFAKLVIRDTGNGISPALLPVIFDPFRQGDLRVAAADLGIGLGLALTRELVASITVASRRTAPEKAAAPRSSSDCLWRPRDRNAVSTITRAFRTAWPLWGPVSGLVCERRACE